MGAKRKTWNCIPYMEIGMTTSEKTAVLLMAHGSRNAEANNDLFYFVEQLALSKSFGISEGGFLELAEPSITDAGRTCVAKGAERVLMLPYFLSAGIHVRRDITAIRDELNQEFPHVQFVLAEPIGRHPKLLEILLERALETN